MSTNLHAKAGDAEVELWQTPSWITWMICVRPNGHIAGEFYDDERQEPPLTGDEAKRALRAYLFWAYEALWHEMERPEEVEDFKRHREAINDLADKRDDLVVWAA